MSEKVLRIRNRLFLLILICASGSVFAEAEMMTRKKGQTLPFVLTAAIRAKEAPTSDGKLDDACWSRAAEADDFVLYGGRGYATEKTVALTLFDRRNLYIGVRCDDSEMDNLKTEIEIRDDAVFTDDCVEIFIIPPDNPLLSEFPQSARDFHIIVNSRGAQYDEIGMSAPATWDAEWESATSVHDDRWELEISLPFAQIQSAVKRRNGLGNQLQPRSTVEG